MSIFFCASLVKKAILKKKQVLSMETIFFWLMLFKLNDVKKVLFEWHNVDKRERVFWELKCVNITAC